MITDKQFKITYYADKHKKFITRVNHTLRHENQTYFALEKQRDKFREECK
jgi:hypothetical protein